MATAAATAQSGGTMGNCGYTRPKAKLAANPRTTPPAAPSEAIKPASTRNRARTLPPDAPSAFSRPISARRCATETSITFMISTPATPRLIAAMPPTARVSAPQDPVEGREHRILGNHRDVFLALVPGFQQRQRIRLDARHGGAAARLDQDAEQRRRVEQLLRRRDRNHHHFVGVEAHLLALRRQRADDPETAVADAHPVAERVGAAEQLGANLVAQHAHRRGLIARAGRQEMAAAQMHVADGQQRRGRAQQHRLAAQAAARDLGRADIQRRHAGHPGDAGDGIGIVQRQIARGLRRTARRARRRWFPRGRE